MVWHSAAPVEVGRGVLEVLEEVLVDNDDGVIVDGVDIVEEFDADVITLEVTAVKAEVLLEEVLVPLLMLVVVGWLTDVLVDVLPDVPADVLVFVLARLLVDDSDAADEVDEVLVTTDVDVLEAVAGMI